MFSSLQKLVVVKQHSNLLLTEKSGRLRPDFPILDTRQVVLMGAPECRVVESPGETPWR